MDVCRRGFGFLCGVVVLLALPMAAVADPVLGPDFRLALDTERGFFEFGSSSLDARFDLEVRGFKDQLGPTNNVALEIHSGPLLSVVIQNEELTQYRYGAGRVEATVEWQMPDGTQRSGTFAAFLPEFSFWVDREDVVGDTDYPNSIEDIVVGPGMFDPVLARALGVSRRTGAGVLYWALENIHGDPPSDIREANHFRDVHLSVPTAVPEPGLLGLALSGAASALWRAYKRRA